MIGRKICVIRSCRNSGYPQFKISGTCCRNYGLVAGDVHIKMINAGYEAIIKALGR